MIDSRKSNWALILVLAVLGLFPRILGAAGIEEPLKAALELHESGKIKEAIAEYDKVIKTHPKLAEAYFNRGNAYYDLGANQPAIKD
jgi:tetratricopeptide (TPR) repeat protein